MQIEINGRPIGPQFKPYVVAEIGQNHNGDAYEAVRMISMAVKAGCDAVKFQLRNAEAEYSAEVLDAPHPNPANAFGETYREHRAALDLSISDLALIQKRIQYNEWPITMFVTPCDVSCVAPLVELNMPAYKVASKDLTNLPLVEAVAKTGKPVILSTGMAVDEEIETACDLVDDINGDFAVMHCTSEYPCPNDHVDLRVLKMMDSFHCKHSFVRGYSDHTVGILAGPLAVAMGASIIEKHITLSRCAKGTDHACALEKDGLERYVRDCRNAYTMLGVHLKRLYTAGWKNRANQIRKAELHG